MADEEDRSGSEAETEREAEEGAGSVQTDEAEEPEEEEEGRLATWAERTTVHGVLDAYEANSAFCRLLWVILVLAAAGIAGWQIYELIKAIATPPHFTTRTSYQEEVELRFPNVTICNFNRAVRSRVEELGLDTAALESIYYSYAAMPDIASMVVLEQHLANQLAWERYHNNTNGTARLVDRIVRYVGPRCDEMLLSSTCSYGGYPFDCCADSTEVLNQWGKCIVINAPRAFGNATEETPYPRQLQKGNKGGLKILLSTANDIGVSDSIFNVQLDSGVAVSVNYDPYEPYVDSVMASTGQKTYMKLAKVVKSTKRASVPIFPTPCTDDAELKYLKAGWSSANCIVDCELQRTMELIGCGVLFDFGVDTDYVVCNASRIDQAHEIGAALMGEPAFLDCVSMCHEPCRERTEIAATTTSVAFPRNPLKPFLKGLLDRVKPNVSMEDVLALNVYFVDFTHQALVQSEKLDLISFVSNVGGQLGLWMGVSIISVVQFFALLCSCGSCPVGSPLKALKRRRKGKAASPAHIDPPAVGKDGGLAASVSRTDSGASSGTAAASASLNSLTAPSPTATLGGDLLH